jgi:cation diffusion facilitator CzcD-associated flavoprotein CzcO
VRTEVVVIGAGQAGLSAAYHLARTGTDFVVLDDASAPGGAWQHRWQSLTLGQAHDIHGLPGMELADTDPDESAATAIPRYFAEYERAFALPVRRPVRVRSVRHATTEETDGELGLLIAETDAGTWLTRGLVNATGTWQKPFWPAYPGQATFTGRQMHSRDYRAAAELAGQRVVVVGGGASAVQLLLEIATVADTTWVTRRPPVWGDPTFDEDARRLAVARVEERTRAGLPPLSVVSATGLPLTVEYRRALDSGLLDRLPMFERIVPDGVVWAPNHVPPAPEHLAVDTILWATGYRSSLDHLAPLHLRTRGGGIVMDGPEVVADPRVQLVGYGPSASTVGANRAGRAAVRNLRRLLGF